DKPKSAQIAVKRNRHKCSVLDRCNSTRLAKDSSAASVPLPSRPANPPSYPSDHPELLDVYRDPLNHAVAEIHSRARIVSAKPAAEFGRLDFAPGDPDGLCPRFVASTSNFGRCGL